MTKKLLTVAIMAKNEAHVIARAIESVKDIAECVYVLDTGSTDSTTYVARQACERLEIPFVQSRLGDKFYFDVARSALLDAVRTDIDSKWTLMLDADDTINVRRPDLFLESLATNDEPGLRMVVKHGDMQHSRVQLFNNAYEWEYRCPVHEYPHLEGVNGADLKCIWEHNAFYQVVGGGARSLDPQKYHNDAMLIEDYLEDFPSSPDAARLQYYLGQSLRDAGFTGDARDAFNDRASLFGAWEEEGWMALLESAKCHQVLYDRGAEREDPTVPYLIAFDQRPWRSEPLLHLARWHYRGGRYGLAFHLFVTAKSVEESAEHNDVLFLEKTTPVDVEAAMDCLEKMRKP